MTVEAPAARGLGALQQNVTQVWSNRNVRRLQLAYVGSGIGTWAYGMAIVVWAYGQGGAALVGAWAGVRMLLSAFTAPIGGVIADRVPRRTFMLANDATCLALVCVTALAIYLDAGTWTVIIPATLLSMVQATFRSAQSGLLPSLVDSPKQLTAANATSEIIESTTIFVGPALAGLLLTIVGVVPVVLFNALSFVWSLLLVFGIQPPKTDVARAAASQEDGEPPPEESFWVQTLGGFKAIFRDRDLLAMTGLVVVNGLMNGVVTVVCILVAAEILGDSASVGWLNAILGAFTIVGGVIMLSMAGRVRLGRLMVIGVLGWCIPLVALGIAPHIVVIVIAFAVIGLVDPMINVGFGVIPARLVSDRVLSRVYASTMSLYIAASALGAFITPVLVARFNLSTAVIVFGAVGIMLALLCALQIPHLDQRLAAPRGLELLRQVPLFHPLSPAMLEQMTGRLVPRSAQPGEAIVSEGEVSDLFYVIESGTVEVTQAGQVLRTEGPGDVFGEIGLLQDVPRTATVTAVDTVELLALSREDFLGLMAGEDTCRSGVADLATRRLAV